MITSPRLRAAGVSELLLGFLDGYAAEVNKPGILTLHNPVREF